MSPLFYEDSLGAKLVEKATAAMDAAREQGAHPEAVELSESDQALVDDPQALAEAELVARGVDPQRAYEQVTADRSRGAGTESFVTTSIVTWSQDMSNLGATTAAIGVFDGVHLGHQALLQAAVTDARERGIRAVAVTFDRDPDQVVSPSTAAPQLLTLADKLACIADSDVDVILVVPFTPALAEMAPESFVDSVLLSAMRPLSVHVGRDFRFGTRATGDVGTLQRIGLGHGFEVRPHDLVASDGVPVTSTRIRSLVAAGDVVAAAALLCRRPRVAGIVHRGRGEGAKLGFPTANVVPVPYAALPANGVYAGRAILEDGIEWAAAISVGTPPTFPEARDYLETHLVGFEGDLYDQTITLEFFERLRNQEAYASTEDLTNAIAGDVAAALDIAGFESDDDEWDEDGVEGSGGVIVDDPDVLAAAEAQAASYDPDAVFEDATGEWVELLGNTRVSGLLDAAGWNAFMLTSPLDAAGIPFVWDPYPPGEMPAYRPAYGVVDRPFRLLVQSSDLARAQRAMGAASVPPTGTVSATGSMESGREADISDPTALEAAEAAVRELAPGPVRDTDDALVVLVSGLPHDTARLETLDHALRAAGVEPIWEPYPPQEAPLLRVALLGENAFTISVWNSELDIARAVLHETMPAE